MAYSEDRRSRKKLVDKVLGDPTLYPDALLSWLPRWMAGNVNFQIERQQLPTIETMKLVGDSGNAQFQNSWVNFGGSNEAAHYYKDPFGRVFIGGTVKSGTVGAVIFTLPPGYRPQYALIYAVSSNSAFGICTVFPDGTVVATAGSNVYFSMSGINFRAYT